MLSEPGLHGELACFCGSPPSIFGPEATGTDWVVGCGSETCTFGVLAAAPTSEAGVREWNRMVGVRPRPCLCGVPVIPVVSERTGDVLLRCRNADCLWTASVSTDMGTEIAVREWNDLIQTPQKKEKK